MKGTRRWVSTVGSMLVALALLAPRAEAQHASHGPDNEDPAIRHVLVSAYIEGMHKNMSRAAARTGFHPDFVMSVRGADGGVTKVSIDQWIGRMEPEGTPPGREVTYEVSVLSRAGNAAVAQMDVFFDGQHQFTDFFGLYRYDEGWRIVNKIFHSHR